MPEEQAGFRETITTSAEARGRFLRQISGTTLYGDVWLRVQPLERGQGFEFVNALDGIIRQEYIKSVEEGVREAMENGVLQGYPMTDLRVILFDGSYHPVDSSAWAFKQAGVMALKAAVEKANPIVLGPDAS